MSNEPTIMGNGVILPPLPGGKAVEVINAPLRAIAPALRIAARCSEELDELYRQRNQIGTTNEMLRQKSDEVYDVVDIKGGRRASSSEAVAAFLKLRMLEEAKFTRKMLLPRAVEVRHANDVLESICAGRQNIDSATALKMLSVLQRVLIKKKDDPITLMAYAGLFDQEIDCAGVSLSLWKEVPRHPVVIALAIHRLFHKQVFAPAPSELCDACRTVADRLENAKLRTWDWLYSLSRADLDLYRDAYEQWEGLYTTPESFAVAAAFEGFGMKHELEWICGRNSVLDDMKHTK